MSISAHFSNDIRESKIPNMDCVNNSKTEESIELQDESPKMEKLKEAHLLLKKKLSLSHELIKQYNDKMKECQDMNMELELVKNNMQKITQKHNASLTKIMQLELENEEYRQQIGNFSKISTEQETKIAADRQHLQQLIFRVQELEHKQSGNSKRDESLKEKIKTLENKLKELKKSHEIEIKMMEVKLNNIKTAEAVPNQIKKETKVTHEKSTCTRNELDPVIIKPKTVDKCILTNDFYNIKDDPYPLFCSKCEIKFDQPPLDQILKQMSSCPSLITEVRSPLRKSDISKSCMSPPPVSQKEFVQFQVIDNNLNNRTKSLETAEVNSNISKSDFQRLEEKICSLERKLNKKIKKAFVPGYPLCDHSYRNNCYLGSYPNLFQSGGLTSSQFEFFEFQKWQQSLRHQKRSRQMISQKTNLKRRKFGKKRKLEDGTSEWNIDPISCEEFSDSDQTNTFKDDSEILHDSSEAASPLAQIREPINEYSKHCNSNEFRSSKQKKRDKLVSLFSPVHRTESELCDLNTNTHADEEISSKFRVPFLEINSPLSDAVSEGEAIANSTRMPEPLTQYETIECTLKKQLGDINKPVKKSTKHSLVKKIRNLKKNCNGNKPLVNKIISTKKNPTKLTSNQSLEETVVAHELENNDSHIQPIENGQRLGLTDSYCPTKKHRIAHNVHKPEHNSHNGANKNIPEISKIDTGKFSHIKENFVDIDIITGSACQLADKNVSIEYKENSNSVVQCQNKNSLKNTVDTKDSQLVSDPMIKNVEIETNKNVINHESMTNTCMVNENPNDKESVSLQPYINIPEIYLNFNGNTTHNNATAVPENNKSKDHDCVINLNSDPENDTLLKRVDGSSVGILTNTESINVQKSGIELNSTFNQSQCIDTPLSPESLDNEISTVSSVVCDVPSSVKSEECEKLSNEVSDISKTSSILPIRKYKKRTRVDLSPVSPIRELRSRKIVLSSPKNSSGKNSMKSEIQETNSEALSNALQLPDDVNNRLNKGFGLRALIEQHFEKSGSCYIQNPNKQRKVNKKLHARKENLVLKELAKLVRDEEWAKPVLQDVLKRLSKFKTHTIARCTVNFLSSKAEENEELDRTHTPPAPLLSKSQQRILTMLVVLNRTFPNIINLVQAGIEFKLFRLGHAPEVEIIEELTRVFTALARVQKDRERVRMLCCDALYCLGLKAMPLIYVILISWPEVFPMAGSSSDPLLLCLINVIMMQECDQIFRKFFALKKLLSAYYSYEFSCHVGNTLTENLMTTLREKRQNGLDTAIILLAKRKGPTWTYKNIIQGGLLQIIIQKVHPSIYDAFCLLGHLMRSFPLDDKEGLVENILEQLCALMESGDGSMQQQEGVATALLSLIRHKQNVVTRAILKWEPSEPVSESMSRQLTTLFNIHPPITWKKFIRKNCTKL